MLPPMSLSPDDIVDVLDDLQHDLGKYLRLPLAFLPEDASQDALREAAVRALFETRRAGDRVEDAASIWGRFCDEVDGALDTLPTFHALVTRVEHAFAWSHMLREDEGPIDRLRIVADFSAVGQAIRDLRDAFDAG